MQNSLIRIELILGVIILFISISFLFYTVALRDSDGVSDRDHKYPYDSSQYSDSDGYSSNPNNTNDFFYNQTECDDIDKDGVENTNDIYDYGNAGIKVYIKSFHGDGKDYTFLDFNVWWDTVDPFFEIEINCYNEINKTWGKIGYIKSKTYWDKKDILDPLQLICDVDEDTTEILVKIFAKDYVNIPDKYDRGRIPDTEEPIDIYSDKNQDYCSVYFYPKQNTYKEFTESGHDDSDTLRKGNIEYYIEVVGI